MKFQNSKSIKAETLYKNNTKELDCIIKDDFAMRDRVVGVYAADEIPTTITDLPMWFIANSEIQSSKGRHWLAFYVENKHRYFLTAVYDQSYYSNYFQSFFDNNDLILTYNTKRLQSMNSNVCGYYSLFYLIFQCRNIPLSKIVRVFSDDINTNDAFVYEFITNAFTQCTKNK